MMVYNKDLKCIEIILINGVLRRFNNGNCLFRDKNGLEDRLDAVQGMTIREYRTKLKEFIEKHGVDLDSIIEFARKNRNEIEKDRAGRM